MSNFLTWDAIYTIAGAAAVTAYAVQFLKQFNFIKKLNSQAVAYVIALIVITAATYFTGHLTFSTLAMVPISALLVCFSSNGAYDSISKSISSSTQSVTVLVKEVTSAFAAAINTLKASVQSATKTLEKDSTGTAEAEQVSSISEDPVTDETSKTATK